MSAFVEISDELVGAVEMSKSDDRDVAVYALGIVRDGVITGEGPTTRGRIHFSRALDAQDAAWCARILTAKAVAGEPVSRAEAESFQTCSCKQLYAPGKIVFAAPLQLGNFPASVPPSHLRIIGPQRAPLRAVVGRADGTAERRNFASGHHGQRSPSRAGGTHVPR